MELDSDINKVVSVLPSPGKPKLRQKARGKTEVRFAPRVEVAFETAQRASDAKEEEVVPIAQESCKDELVREIPRASAYVPEPQQLPQPPLLVVLSPDVLVGLCVCSAFLGIVGYDAFRQLVDRVQSFVGGLSD